MSAIEQVQAYNQGVRDALAQAAAAADAIEKLPNYREGRQGFASEALKAFSEVGTELLLGKHATARRRVVKECLAFALQDELGLDLLTRHSRNRSARSVNAEIGSSSNSGDSRLEWISRRTPKRWPGRSASGIEWCQFILARSTSGLGLLSSVS